MFIMIFTLSGMKHPVVQMGLNNPKHGYFPLDYTYLFLNSEIFSVAAHRTVPKSFYFFGLSTWFLKYT